MQSAFVQSAPRLSVGVHLRLSERFVCTHPPTRPPGVPRQDAAGLQFKVPGLGWAEVPLVEDAFICSVGDVLDRMTGEWTGEGKGLGGSQEVRGPRITSAKVSCDAPGEHLGWWCLAPAEQTALCHQLFS
jgi:hypothetical protein